MHNYTSATQALQPILSPKAGGAHDLNLTKIEMIDETQDGMSDNPM